MAMANPYNYKKPVGTVTRNDIPNKNQKNISNYVAVNKTTAKSNDYLEQKIMSAKPEELTLMLYDGIIKFVSQAILYNGQNRKDKSSSANIRAQLIIEELRVTLNMDYEISENLEKMYIYMNDTLVEANIQKDNEKLNIVLDLVKELRDTWKEAMSI